MLIEVFLFLIAAGIVPVVIKGKRLSFVYLLLLTISMALMLGYFYQNWQQGTKDNFTYDWVSSPYYPIKIHLFSNFTHYAQIFPFFLISVVMIIFNCFSKIEKRKLEQNGLICLNLGALIMLICGENTIQLLVSACVIDVLGFYIINESAARRKYIFYNLMADMGLFMLFALIWGYTESIRLSDLGKYFEQGEHRDLVCILLLLCLFIKSGLFLFQTPLQNWNILNMRTIMVLSFLSTPISGYILLFKTLPLLPLSKYSEPLVLFFAYASMVWGGIGAILIDNLRSKLIYLNMILSGLMYALLQAGLTPDTPIFASLILGGFLLSCSLLLVTLGSSNEIYVSSMGGFIANLKLSFMVTLFCMLAYIQVLYTLSQTYNFIPMIALGLISVSTASIWSHIYFSPSNADERVLAMLKNPLFVYWGIILILALYVLYLEGKPDIASYAILSGILLLAISGIFNKILPIYENEQVQESDLFSDFYHYFVIGPVKVLGRVLWLTIDFLVIERTIIYTSRNTVNLLIGFFQKIHTQAKWAYPFFLILGCGMIYGSYILAEGR